LPHGSVRQRPIPSSGAGQTDVGEDEIGTVLATELRCLFAAFRLETSKPSLSRISATVSRMS
jgi:hypothetical protein